MTMAWLKRTTDLLLPRTRAGKERQPPALPDAASRSPSPLLVEPSALLTQPPPLLAALGGRGECMPSTSWRRSIVAHAVLGSEAAGLNSLPAELLFLIFTRLDAYSLCQMAQVSTSCASFVDDPLVWSRSLAGHSKDAERQMQLRAVQLRAERVEAEARIRRQRWRQWRRRMLGVLQAACGAALILLPLMATFSRRRADGRQRLMAAPALKIKSALEGVADAIGETARQPQFDGLVWAAATSSASCAA